MFHLEPPGLDNPVFQLDLDNVAEGELDGLHLDLLTIPAHHRVSQDNLKFDPSS